MLEIGTFAAEHRHAKKIQTDSTGELEPYLLRRVDRTASRCASDARWRLDRRSEGVPRNSEQPQSLNRAAQDRLI